MPRLKASGKPRDPIYTQARWGPKRTTPEAPNVRTGGRIKKAKTIFDPSESTMKGILRATTPEPEKKANKRRMSVTSQSSHISTRTSVSAAAAPSPAPPATPPSVGKRRRLDSSASSSKKQQPPNRSKEALPIPPVADDVSTPPSPASSKPKQMSLLLNPMSSGSSSKSATNGRSKDPETTSSHNKRFSGRHQCSVCWNFGDRNPPGWIKCNGCSSMAHKQCIESWATAKLGPWLCAQCHVCFECEEEVTQEELDCVHCSACFIAYHYACLPEKDVPSSKEAKDDWKCKHCAPLVKKKEQQQRKEDQEEKQNEEEEEEDEDAPLDEVEILPMPEKEEVAAVAKKTGRGRGRKAKKEEGTKSKGMKVDESVPDASKWTASDVYEFFAASFPKEAAVFQEQEIDGVSLLLMRRSDVIQGLGFKLGPALRIYKQIIMLQTRDTDPTLTWY